MLKMKLVIVTFYGEILTSQQPLFEETETPHSQSKSQRRHDSQPFNISRYLDLLYIEYTNFRAKKNSKQYSKGTCKGSYLLSSF